MGNKFPEIIEGQNNSSEEKNLEEIKNSKKKGNNKTYINI